MRLITISLILAAAGGLVFAAPVNKQGGVPAGDDKPLSTVLLAEAPGQGRPGPILFVDGDLDGFDGRVDCNDDAFDVNPAAVELANGLDDDCDGVMDDGFDTSVDRPASPVSLPLWPEIAIPGSSDLISMDASPRVVWNGSGKAFIAVWVDVADRLRGARVAPDGTLIDNPPLVLLKAVGHVDAAWTGSRLGVVYEDLSKAPPAVRLTTFDGDLGVISDALVAEAGGEPKLAWGQDRFGIVWKAPYGANALRFQRVDRYGVPFSEAPEELANSGSHAAIVFSGGGVDATKTPMAVHEGAFGIVFEAYYSFAATGDVILASRPRDAALGTPGWVRVYEHGYDPNNRWGALPTIAANPAGFAVAWHVLEADATDGAMLRYVSLDGLTPVQEFVPDADAGRYARLAWTGSEFVIANDNITNLPAGEYDVHVRRVDASCNTHPAAGWGPWNELNLSTAVAGGTVSTHPDLANTGQQFGVVWVERDAFSGGGRLWFAEVTHE